ncbi:MAG: HIT domain-containing protein [Opitutaceae bacterium]|nr:HIT domain-containing protein [Opitutaceae bacterium]
MKLRLDRLVFLLLPVCPVVHAAPPPCVFCEIVAGTREHALVHRDDRVLAFLSIGPRNPGHTLVVPVRHAETFGDVPPDTLHAMTDVARAVAAAFPRAGLRCDGYQLQMNNGRAAGQTVGHAHLHVIPRFAGEAPAEPEEARRVAPAALASVAARLRAALAADPPPAPRPPLPALGEEVPLERIREICVAYGLPQLWRKIERDPPPRPFRSDGCTGWFDDWQGVSLYPAGFLHDLKYWAGYPGEDVERLVADAELMIDVARLLGSTAMAETMFRGVRIGGGEQLNAPFSWGFGRQPPRP